MTTAAEIIERFKGLKSANQLRVAADLLDQAEAPECDLGECIIALRAAATISQAVGEGLKEGIAKAIRNAAVAGIRLGEPFG